MAWIHQETDTVPWLNTKTDPNIINNTWEVYNFLNPLGFTIESICGILGNMRAESYVNPGQWELGHGGSTSYGWGLIQWTPGTSLTNYVTGDWYDGALQMDLVVREMQQDASVSGRWIPTHRYPYNYDEFRALTSISEAVRAYFYERERGTWSNTRITYADECYEILTGDPPTPPTPQPIDIMELIMLFKRKKYNTFPGRRKR